MKHLKQLLFIILFSCLSFAGNTQTLVLDIANGTDHSNPRKLKAGKSGIVFLAEDPHYGLELFRSDGTAEGTNIFMDHEPGEKDIVLWDFEVVDDKVYYAIDKKRAVELRIGDISTGKSTLIYTMDTRIDYSVNSPEKYQLQFTRLNNRVFFVFTNETNQKEIWSIDINNNQVLNIQTSRPWEELTFIATAENQVFFTTYRSRNDTIKLWSLTDQLKVSHAGFVYGEPKPNTIATQKNSLFFGAYDSLNWKSKKKHTEVLWSTDGTLQNFKPLLNPQTGSSFKRITHLTKFDNALFFIDYDEETRRTLWKLNDPIEAPEKILGSVKNNYGISYENYIHSTDKFLYFFIYFNLQDSFQLCRTSGKPGEYEALAKYKMHQEPHNFIGTPHALHLKNRFISSVSDNASVVSLLYEPSDSIVHLEGFARFPAFENGVLFLTKSKSTSQFYFYNSKTKSTKKFLDVSDELITITWEKKVAWNNKFFMVNQTERYGVELWVYNTDQDSFYILKDINNKNLSSSPASITAYKNSVFCTALDLKRRADFRPRKIIEINLDSSKPTGRDVLFEPIGGNPIQVIQKDSLLLLNSSFLFNGKTTSILDKNLKYYHYWGKLNGKYIFSADNAQYRSGLYALNATFEKPVLLTDPSDNNGSRILSKTYINYKDSLFFFVGYNSSQGSMLWQTDGTTSGTILRTGELGKNSISSHEGFGVQEIHPFKDDVLFRFSSKDTGSELWRFNPRTGASIVKDICEGCYSGPTYLTTFNNWVYFNANDRSGKAELWRTDGTAENTISYKKYTDIKTLDPREGTKGLAPFSLMANSKFLFFKTNFRVYETWSCDETQAPPLHLSKDTPRPFNKGYYSKSFKVGPYVYFQASDHRGLELWQTDGLPQNTRIAFDLNPGPADGSPDNLVAIKGEVYFSGDDGIHGNEIFKFTPNGNTKELCPIKITGGKNQIWNLQIVKPSFIPTKARVELWSTDGALLQKKINFSGGKTTLDFRKFEPGTYWLYIVDNGKTWIKAVHF